MATLVDYFLTHAVPWVVILANLAALARQSHNLYDLRARYYRHKAQGKNGALKLLLQKRIMLALLFATFSLAWALIAGFYVLLDLYNRAIPDWLRGIAAVVFIIWAVSTVVYGEADAWLGKKIEVELDQQEGLKGLLQAEHDILVTQVDAPPTAPGHTKGGTL